MPTTTAARPDATLAAAVDVAEAAARAESGDQVGEYVSFYAGVQGLEGYLERAERLGGKVVQQPTPISETARVAMLLDPEGHRIGLLEQS